jgi:hypothetical protein
MRLYDGTGTLLKQINVGNSSTFTFKLNSTVLRINNYLSRGSNDGQVTQADHSTAQINALSVV